MLAVPPELAEKLGTLPQLTSEEYESLRTQWGNAVAGSLDGLDCPLCCNRGYTVCVDEKGNQVCVECACMAKRRSLKRIERSGLQGALAACTFGTFRTEEPWQAEMKRKAVEFLGDYSGKWFAAMGCVGAGKSHICTAICGELLNAGKEVRYMLWRDHGGRLKAAVNNSEEYSRLVEPLKAVDVLYIDDFFKTQSGKEVTQGDVNLAFEILNYRYINPKLVTILSSEKTIEEILDIDEAVGSRIYERCRDYYIRLVNRKNWRLI